MCEICQSWPRVQVPYKIALDGLPLVTNHHPNCPYYNDSLMDVWKVTDGSATFFTDDEQDAKAESGAEDGYCATITREKMHREIFENLPEFEGF